MKPTLILVPGLMCDETVWLHQTAALRDIADIRIAVNGARDSLVDMALAIIAEAPPLFAIAGHSMGGRVALEVIRRVPERVTALALLDTGYQPRPDGEAGDREAAGRFALLTKARRDGMRAMGAEWLRGMLHPARLGDKALNNAILDMIERKTPELYEAQITALLARPDATPVLAGIRCPTLVLCGEEDGWALVTRHHDMHAAITGSTLRVIPDCGHMATMERPEAVSQALREWLLASARPAAGTGPTESQAAPNTGAGRATADGAHPNLDALLSLRRIAVIGFGEAGSILGGDLAAQGLEVVTYDILLDAPATRGAMLEKAARLQVRCADTLPEALDGADLVISAVTASSSAEVASAAGRVLRGGQIFLDINSVSPATKRSNAHALHSAGADYVEAAVMAPVPPQRLKVPMLLGGERAAELATALRALGMNTTAIATDIGIASAVKMCRSIVIKGLEALTLECVMAARKLGAEEPVLASLHATFPQLGWQESLPDYLVSRVAEHGRRRAAEMREVARTLEDVGIEPLMALATAARQAALVEQMSERGIAYPRDAAFSWRALVDALAVESTGKR